MPHSRLLFLGCLLPAVLPLRAEIVLTPFHEATSSSPHVFTLGLAFNPPSALEDPTVVLLTATENWESGTASHTPTIFNRVFDANLAGVRTYQESQAAYLPGPDLYVFTGGILDPLLYTYSRNTGTATESLMLPFTESYSLLNGLVARNISTVKGGNPAGTDVFGSSGVTSSLYRFTAGVSGPQTGVAFGNSGAGQVSPGVGALAIGPDGRLNVLDTGRQEILQFDAGTLDYLGSIPLANTTTDNTSFTISSTGYIFTANQITQNGEDLTGVIYDYASGDYVGTFSAPSIWGPGGNGGIGGKLAMTADNDGYIYVLNDMVSDHVQFYDTNAIPEPSTTALLIGAGAMVFTFPRRRSRKA